MTERRVPWIPIAISGCVILVALGAMVALKHRSTPTRPGSTSINLDSTGSRLGQLEPSQTGGVGGPAPTGINGSTQGSIEGPPSLDVQTWHQLFQGEIR